MTFSTDVSIPISSANPWFNSFAEVLLSWIMENNDVSSANSFTVDIMSSDRSLMYIRKKSGPKMDPCGTPAFTSNHSDVWPSSTTLWNLFVKKLLISSSNASEIPTDLSLKIGPPCHALSKSLDTTKKTPRDSRVEYASKVGYILWTMDNNWFTQESLAGKLDWSAESNLCSSRYS